ncbi:hypothetical protein PVAG01_09549 [Phlyctema vagabunda]|uniref:Uncharacterized protein n=1 Tax=Phlyctema vagabunda TaxID=108571 RepID=A0ABR4P7M7_9HELO
MAAPPEITLGDLSGQWVINKTLSDDPDPVLAMQGVGWWTRKAIAYATVTLHVKQYVDEQGLTHIDIEQTATGGIKGTTELRTLDWVEREHNDHIFGDLKGKGRWLNFDSGLIDDDYLKEDWLEGPEEVAGPNGEKHIQSFVDAAGGWTGNQIWGFAMIGNERRYTRRFTVIKGDQVKKIRLVYDWQGKK